MNIDPRTATPCRTVAFSADGSTLAEANYLGFITLRETARGGVTKRFLAQTALIETVRFEHETGLLLLVGAGFEGNRDHGVAKIIDPHTGRRLRELRGHSDDATDTMSLSGPFRRVVTVGLDRKVIVHDVEDPQSTWVWSEYEDYLNTCAERPGYQGQFAVAGDSPFSYVLDAEVRSKVAQLDTPGDCNGLLWSQDGRYLLVGDDHGRIIYFDGASNWRQVGECAIGGATKRMVADPADESRALVAAYDGRIWSIPRRPGGADPFVAVERRRGMWGINVAATRSHLAVPSFFDRAFLLDRSSSELADTGPEPQPTFGCNWVAVHPSGRALAVTHDDGCIRVRNAADGSLLRLLGPDTDSLYMGAAFHPQFPLIATIDFYGELLLYNVDDGRVVWRSDMGFGPGISVDFSPCGRFLAAGGYGWSGRMLILAPDGLPVEVRELDSPNKGVLKCVSFAGSNRLLVASGDGTLVVHERFSGRWSAVRSVRGLPKMELANGVAASPDGRIAYVVARDQSLRAFSVESGEELACGLAHVRGVKSVHASPCGRYVATGSYDRTVMLWDSSNLTVRLPPVRLANSGVSSVRFGPEGVVFSCSFDGVTMAIEQETGRIRWMRTASDVSEGA